MRGEPKEFERDIRGFCVLVTDVTRLKQAEEALLRVERQLQASEHLAARSGLAAPVSVQANRARSQTTRLST